MAWSALRNTVSDLIIIRSPRVSFHPLIPSPRQTISADLCHNIEFVSLDEKLQRSLVVCKHCHMMFNNARWNRQVIGRHLDKFHAINIKDTVADGTKVDNIAIPKMKGGKRHSTKPLSPLPVSSETLLPEIATKNAEPDCVPQQTSEDGIQALNLVTVSDVVSESTPARDTGLQVALAQEPEATKIECKPVPSTDAIDFCSSPNPSKPKAKSTRKRKANKEAGGKATFSRAKGNASEKEGICADSSEKEGIGADASEKEGICADSSEDDSKASN